MNPNMSAEAQLNGEFDYTNTPLAPAGTNDVIHEKPGARGTWDLQVTKGWYIGGTPEHYQCWTIHVTKTAAERISDKMEFFHNNANYCRYHQNS